MRKKDDDYILDLAVAGFKWITNYSWRLHTSSVRIEDRN